MNGAPEVPGTSGSLQGEAQPPMPPGTPALRMVLTLALAGALAGLLLSSVHGWAQPRIDAHHAAVLRTAILEVLADPQHYETLYVVDDALAAQAPAGADTSALDRVHVGFDAAGGIVGFAIEGAEPGFQDVIRLLFGYDAGANRLIGMRVLESKETPGLGDKIEKDSAFVREFRGVAAPLAGVKSGAGDGTDNEVDMITGATISSRAIIDIINHRLERLGPALQAYMQARP